MLGAKFVSRNAEEWIGKPEDAALQGVALDAGKIPVTSSEVAVEDSREIGPLASLVVRHPSQCIIKGMF
jgi:hypothetical protein